MKASTIVVILFLTASIALTILSFQKDPNQAIVEAFVTSIKVLVGAFGGTLVGEKLHE